MPSDSRVIQALAAVAPPIAEFRTLMRDALTQGEAFLAAQTAGAEERITRARAELGRFSEGHIDPARFAALFPAVRCADPATLEVLRQAVGTLRAVLNRGEAMFVVAVPSGGQLGDVLRQALAALGQALGAVILIELVRSERYRAEQHERLLAPVEFPAWNNAARQVAPPLAVTLDGADLHAGALAQFTDGREKIVLVVRGACAPAPLVRCITPGTLVLQTADGRGLDRVAAFDGPAIAAIVSKGAATFLHDPAAGREQWQRLVIWDSGEVPKRAIGGVSSWQMGEELKLLADLARTPFSIPGASGVSAPATGAGDAVDRIASWLLGQSELPSP
jgi:hypothetical protein